MKTIVAAAALLLTTGAAIAYDKTTAAKEFSGFIEMCAANAGDRTVDRCVEEQVDSLDSYLGDIVGEMTGYVTGKAGKAMLRGQVAFEEYRRLTCTYEQEAHPEEKYAGLFCYHRLTSQRVEDVREGLDFALFR